MLAAGSALSGAAPTSLLPSYFPPVVAAPAPPPAPAVTAASTGSPAVPDLSKLVSQDPAYQQALADEKAAVDAAGAARDLGINQSLIGFGAVPDFASVGKSLGLSDAQIQAITGGIDPNTSSLAAQNTNSGDSVLAQLNQAHDQAIRTLRAQLAARGTLESGATGVGVGLDNQTYQHGLSNAYQTLMQNLQGFQDKFLGAEGSARTALENAASAAYDRAVQMAEKYPSAAGGSTPPPPGARTETGTIPSSVVSAIVPRAIAAGEPVSEHGLGMGFVGGVSTRRHPALVNPYVTGQKRFG